MLAFHSGLRLLSENELMHQLVAAMWLVHQSVTLAGRSVVAAGWCHRRGPRRHPAGVRSRRTWWRTPPPSGPPPRSCRSSKVATEKPRSVVGARAPRFSVSVQRPHRSLPRGLVAPEDPPPVPREGHVAVLKAPSPKETALARTHPPRRGQAQDLRHPRASRRPGCTNRSSIMRCSRDHPAPEARAPQVRPSPHATEPSSKP